MKSILSLAIIATVLYAIQTVNVDAQIFGSRHPQAPTVTASQIKALQSDKRNQGNFLIVDVRAKTESDVSMIPGAITQAEFEKTKGQHQGKAVIVYCTVGYRSGIYAQKLKKDGWRAWNYQGSILDWCNNRLPVVTPQGKSTNRVHTYNSSYSLATGYLAVH